MHDRLARFVIVIVLGGCDELANQETEGVALATLRGTLSLGRDVEPPDGNLHVSVLWRDPTFGSLHEPGVVPFPGGDPLAPGVCADGQPTGWRLETRLLEQPVRVDTDFPSGFSVELTEPPPADALFDFPDGSGVSTASGDLVVYDDRNANGLLDPSTFDVMSPDLIFGSSQGATPWGVGQPKHYSIVYLTDDTELPEGDGKAGYSLVTTESDGSGLFTGSAQRLSEATIDLVLAPTNYAQQMACTVMCKVEATALTDDPVAFLAGDVGTPVASDLGVGTSVWSRQDGATNMLTLARCSKRHESDSYARYELDLSVVITDGCTETTSFQIFVVHASASDDVGLPCPVYDDVDESAFPVEP